MRHAKKKCIATTCVVGNTVSGTTGHISPGGQNARGGIVALCEGIYTLTAEGHIPDANEHIGKECTIHAGAYTQLVER